MSVIEIIMLSIGCISAAAVFILLAVNKKSAVKQWLIWAVSEAEKALGSGTGQLKLRKVYDMFTDKFRVISLAVPFAAFSAWVDSALEVMRDMLVTNSAVAEYIAKGE